MSFVLLFFQFYLTSHNKLPSLPVSMASLASLSSLKMDHNCLTTLGIELSQMKQLEEMVSELHSFNLPFSTLHGAVRVKCPL